MRLKNAENHIKINSGKINSKNLAANICFGISSAAGAFLLFCAIKKIYSALLFLPLIALAVIFFSFDFHVLKKNSSIYKALAACGLSCLLGVSFYHVMAESGKVQALAAGLGVDVSLLLLCAAVAGAALAAYSLLYLLCLAEEHYAKALHDLVPSLPSPASLKKAFLALTAIYLLSALSIIRANIDYIDDMSRKASGNAGWEDFSRYLSNLLSKLLNADGYLTDISPLPQILAVLLTAAASLILIVTFTKGKNITPWNIIAILPVGISPYFLECMTYKFDAPYMALSILASVAPLLFFEYKASFYTANVIIGVLATCMTYQAALGIFPVSVILLLFLKWLDGREIRDLLQSAFRSAAGYLAGVAVYRIFFMTPVNSYVSSEVFSLRDMPGGVLSNLGKYLNYVYQDFNGLWLFFLALIVVSFVLLAAGVSRRNKTVSALAAALTAAVTMCLSFGLYIAFQLPIFACRGMYGFGVWLAIIALICTAPDVFRIPRAACLCLSWCFLAFSFTYGNALWEQQRYVRFRIEMVISDLNGLSAFDGETPVEVQILGTAGVAPVLEDMPQYRGVLHRLVMEDQWYWTGYQFRSYYGMENISVVPSLTEEDLPILFEGAYNRIRGDGKCFLVELK